MNQKIKISYEGEEQLERAEELANRLKLEIDNQAVNCLRVLPDRLVLKIADFTPLSADFLSSTWKKRHAAGKKQGLIRACRPGPGIKIIDATAGWGRDAAILASFGAEVIMLERNPIMATLLADALLRRDVDSKEIMDLTLYEVDASNFLQNLPEIDYPDVIYIDPMHPERQKSALVKKDMQVLQQLIERDEKIIELVELAKTKNKNRVVVKWPQSLPPCLKPTFTISGKTVRFDIYA